ncbi:hypothetical protein DUI87_23572 [Hirundo rustica rustica]|uniref:non-specific serine/threonine protein kinase n=1 Tax=Hirundo rustica rustica TaxID=333673 RepID=A0A3M0JXY6_HIRRU|nr:hypothetical protein DUI87_23572 [Hirundo rustica rustica]
MMARAGAMSDGGVLLAALVLLLAAVAACWDLGHWQTTEVADTDTQAEQCSQSLAQRLPEEPRSPCGSQALQTSGLSSQAATGSHEPPGLVCCFRPCVAAAQELQELMLLHWARKRDMCAALHQDVAGLVERTGEAGEAGPPALLWLLQLLPKPPSLQEAAPSNILHPWESLDPCTDGTAAHTPAIPAGSSGCQRPSILPGASAISDSLHPSQRLSETRLPTEGAESVDRSPSSLGLTDFNSMGTTLTLNMARESPEVQMGAQPDAGELCQEQLAQQQASGSQQLSFHSSQDAVLAVPAVPAGNSLSPVVEMILETPRRILHLQEAAPQQPWTTSKASRGAGQKKELQDLYQRGRQLGSGGFGTVFSGIRLSDGSPVAIKRVARESVLQWVELQSQDLLEFLLERDILCEEMARWIFCQVLEAVRHCTACGVLHRDIKLENLLVEPESGDVKLIDFGCGTFLQEQAYTQFAATVWSLGVLLYVMVCGSLPFQEDRDIVWQQLFFTRQLSPGKGQALEAHVARTGLTLPRPAVAM